MVLLCSFDQVPTQTAQQFPTRVCCFRWHQKLWHMACNRPTTVGASALHNSAATEKSPRAAESYNPQRNAPAPQLVHRRLQVRSTVRYSRHWHEQTHLSPYPGSKHKMLRED